MANPELERLRAEARRKHRSATRKISRLRRAADVELTGTQFDPRRSPKAIGRYNATQLKAYINQLETFNNRQTQFVRGARGSVITSAAWRQFQSAARKVSARNKREFGKIADVELPNGVTIRQRVAMTTPKHPTMGTNLAVNRPFEEIRKSPRGIMGDKGAIALAREMESRLGERWFSNRISNDRSSLSKMVAVMNRPEILQQIDNLSDQQFNILWNYTGFADLLGVSYQSITDAMAGKDEPYFREAAEQSLRDVRELIEWAGTLNMGR